MNDQNKDKEQAHRQAPKPNGAAGATGWKRLLAKKWVFPATYMAAAAIILTFMWLYTGSGPKPLSTEVGMENGLLPKDGTKPNDLAVAVPPEMMQWPVQDRQEVQAVMHFFDSKASNDVRQAAIIEYGDTLTPHMGLDFAREDKQPFDVVAALSGTVTRIETDPLVGKLVELSHPDGTVTIYQSLESIEVAKDMQVKQGDRIGTAGRNELEKDEGIHVHFEVRQNGIPVNPETLIAEK